MTGLAAQGPPGVGAAVPCRGAREAHRGRSTQGPSSLLRGRLSVCPCIGMRYGRARSLLGGCSQQLCSDLGRASAMSSESLGQTLQRSVQP